MDKPEAHLFASLNDRQQRRLIEAFVRVENKLGKQTRHKLRETTFKTMDYSGRRTTYDSAILCVKVYRFAPSYCILEKI